MNRDFDFVIGGIEDGIMAALDTAVGVANEGYVKAIASYGGELDGEQLKRALGELQSRMPLLLVAYGDGDDIEDPPTVPVAGEPRCFRHDCTFTVVCCSADARGDKARRRGGKGVYKMISDVREALGGLTLIADVEGEQIRLNDDPLKYDGVEYLARLPDLTAYAVHFATYFRYSEPDRTEQGELVSELIFTVDNTYQKGDSNLPGVVYARQV